MKIRLNSTCQSIAQLKPTLFFDLCPHEVKSSQLKCSIIGNKEIVCQMGSTLKALKSFMRASGLFAEICMPSFSSVSRWFVVFS